MRSRRPRRRPGIAGRRTPFEIPPPLGRKDQTRRFSWFRSRRRREPAFADAVARCVRLGATRVVVTPFFLLPGKFVTVDLPAAIAAVREEHSNVEFATAEAIGYDDLLVEAVLASAHSAAPAGANRDEPQGAGQTCRLDPRCPLFATSRCPRVEGLR